MVKCLMCEQRFQHQCRWEDLWRWAPLHFDCVCAECRQGFQPFCSESICAGCGRALVTTVSEWEAQDDYHTGVMFADGVYCPDCIRWLQHYPTYYLQQAALLAWSPQVQSWLYRYKYSGDARLAQVVKTVLQQYATKHLQYQWLVLPSSPNSLAERGFHATGHLLTSAGIEWCCPFHYIGTGEKQAHKNRQDRLNTPKLFVADEERVRVLLQQGTRWLLFDDVYTTGRTMLYGKAALFEMIHSLREEKTIEIQGVCLVREEKIDTFQRMFALSKTSEVCYNIVKQRNCEHIEK